MTKNCVSFWATTESWGPVILRVLLAVVMFPHGAQKVLGWWGGHGFEGTMGFFTGSMGIPYPLALCAIAAEFLGPIGLLFGFCTRLAAFGVGVTMAVAAITVHWGNGFFMNWGGNQAGEGFEYHILAFACAAALVVMGGGRCSVDAFLAKRCSK